MTPNPRREISIMIIINSKATPLIFKCTLRRGTAPFRKVYSRLENFEFHNSIKRDSPHSA